MQSIHPKHIVLLLLTTTPLFYAIAQTKNTAVKSVSVPDSIAYKLEDAYVQTAKNAHAAKHVFNLANKKDFNFKNGVYSFKGQTDHSPRRVFIYNKTKLFIFKSVGATDPKGIIKEFATAVTAIGLTETQTIRYAKLLARYLTEETNSIYEIDVKR